MSTHVHQGRNTKSRSGAKEVSQQQAKGDATFQLEDNRPEALVQRKLQAIIHNSPQVQQAAQLQVLANSQTVNLPSVIQKKANPIQRFEDLDAKYADSDQVDDEDRQEWLPKFKRIQQLLNDTGTVKGHLSALAAYMGKNQVSLSEALAKHEAGTWTDARPILIDFVPAPVFEDFVRRGQLFVDLVGKTHGVQTHRIQWYVIKAELGAEFAKATFAEAVHPRWKKGKNMWDWIVDGVNSAAGDFTQPDRLEDYLITEFEGLCSRSDLGKLHNQVSEGHESQKDDRQAMKDKAPPEKLYTPLMKQVMAEHRQLIQATNRLKFDEPEAKDEEKQRLKALISEKEAEEITLLNKIQFERVEYRSGANLIGRGGEVYTFTGWILGSRTQGGRAPTYFAPTVAYPEGNKPGETVPSY